MAARPNISAGASRQTITGLNVLRELPDFSLVLGGPIFQLFRRSHLVGDSLEFLYRRLLVITLVAWLPLLLLTIFDTSAGNLGRLSFVHDVEVHVRFLIALPVLIAAELIVHWRIRAVVRNFVERRIVLTGDLPRFQSAIESALRLRNLVPVELGLVLFVYVCGLWLWQGRVPLETSTWYGTPGGRWHLTAAGLWYVFISIPILQFVRLRWYLRLFIWFRFLWQVSRLNLHLVPLTPIVAQVSPSGARVPMPLGGPIRARSHARRRSCQSNSLSRRNLAVLQAADRWIHSLFLS